MVSVNIMARQHPPWRSHLPRWRSISNLKRGLWRFLSSQSASTRWSCTPLLLPRIEEEEEEEHFFSRNAGIDTACSRDLRRARRAKTQMETEPQTENLVTETPFNEQVLSLEHYPPFNKGAWSWRCESHVCVALMKSDFSLASVVHLVRTRIRATSIDRLFH